MGHTFYLRVRLSKRIAPFSLKNSSAQLSVFLKNLMGGGRLWHEASWYASGLSVPPFRIRRPRGAINMIG